MKISISIFFILMLQHTAFAQLRINEVCSRNYDLVFDFEGDDPDWIEIYNESSSPLSLSGYALSDNENEPLKWPFPNIEIEGNSYILLFASGKDLLQPEMHTNFRLDAESENVILAHASLGTISMSPISSLPGNFSIGWTESNEWASYQIPSPGETNSNGLLEGAINFSHDEGVYTEDIELTLSSPIENTTIHYTLDGSEPSIEDPVFEQALSISSRNGDANVYSAIPSSPSPYIPEDEVFKINTIRARAFQDDLPIGRIYNASYLIDELGVERFGIPIISLISDPTNLFSDASGIYVPGDTWIEGQNGTGNFWQDWERPAHLTIFDEDGNVESKIDLGIKIKGNITRLYNAKSFKLVAREEYGVKNIPFSGFQESENDEFKRLVLRANSGTLYPFGLQDELAFKFTSGFEMKRMDMSNSPYALFLDGEFWGIYRVRTNLDQRHLESECAIDTELLDLIENSYNSADNALHGSTESMSELMSFILDSDLSDPEVYNAVSEEINISSYIDYLIAETYFANNDWPNNNHKYWNDHQGSKWNWLFFDLDISMQTINRQSVSYLFDTDFDSLTYGSWGSALARKLIENEDFKTQFIDRYEHHINSSFLVDSLAPHVVALKEILDPQFNDQRARYNHSYNKELWDGNIKWIVRFLSKRPCFIRDQIMNSFGVEINVPACDDLTNFYFPPDPLSSDGDNSNMASLFPNPSNGIITIRLQNDESDFQIFDTLGRQLEKGTLFSGINSLDLSLPPGLYIIQIEEWNSSFLIH